MKRKTQSIKNVFSTKYESKQNIRIYVLHWRNMGMFCNKSCISTDIGFVEWKRWSVHLYFLFVCLLQIKCPFHMG